jgi:hypothetical protein
MRGSSFNICGFEENAAIHIPFKVYAVLKAVSASEYSVVCSYCWFKHSPPPYANTGTHLGYTDNVRMTYRLRISKIQRIDQTLLTLNEPRGHP